MAAATAGALLAVGLVVDFGYTQRQLGQVKRLSAERERLRSEVEKVERAEREADEIAAHFGGGDLSEALVGQTRVDAVTYLGAVVRKAGLSGSDLSTDVTTEAENLRRIRCSLRFSGTYAQMLNCVRELERG